MGPQFFKMIRVMFSPDMEGAGGNSADDAEMGDAQAESATPAEGEGDPEDQGESEEGGDAAQAEVSDKPKTTPWFQRRIDELTKARREAERDAEASRRQVELLMAAAENAATPEERAQNRASLDAAQIEQKAQELAAQKAAEDAFNSACNAVYSQGKEQHSDFDDVLKSYVNLGGLTAPFISAALETSNPSGVLYTLGKDLDAAAEIMALPPLKQAVAMERLASKLAAPKPVSKAPTPVKPIGTGRAGVGQKDPENMTMAEWLAWRGEQVKGKRA